MYKQATVTVNRTKQLPPTNLVFLICNFKYLCLLSFFHLVALSRTPGRLSKNDNNGLLDLIPDLRGELSIFHY